MFVCLSEFMCTCAGAQENQRVQDALELELQTAMTCLTWVLGIQPGSYLRTACALNY